ncbi:MAG: hypothetical protein MHPDNHAH_03273 [Anaerolineales bacterium]|nr:hypothetical protein [Anaerolineales bacterium]WKZ48424.1 MAG: hypothetical protein QY306_03520 [Anaerolineales bacterium]
MSDNQSFTFPQALDEVSASSAGGSPFLIAYGVTFLITAILSFFLPRETVALIAIFQGGIALPVAFWLERRMGSRRMSAENPLKQLSGQMAFSQALALPLLILVYSLNPGGIPLALAALGGVHFLPYSWLHRSQVYSRLAFTLAFGAFALQVFFKSNAFNLILLLIAIGYGITAPIVYRHAKQLVAKGTT